MIELINLKKAKRADRVSREETKALSRALVVRLGNRDAARAWASCISKETFRLWLSGSISMDRAHANRIRKFLARAL